MAELPRNTACCATCALPLPIATEACGHCQRKPPPWQRAWAPFRYGWPLDRLETRFKFGRDLAAGRLLTALWQRQGVPAELPQLIMPVPLHSGRLRERGYNQAWELAQELAAALKIASRCDLLQRTRATSAQTGLDAAARRRNVRGAFRLQAGALLPAHVALIDDVMTTGTTLTACAKVLRRAGAARVDVWALARVSAPGI